MGTTKWWLSARWVGLKPSFLAQHIFVLSPAKAGPKRAHPWAQCLWPDWSKDRMLVKKNEAGTVVRYCLGWIWSLDLDCRHLPECWEKIPVLTPHQKRRTWVQYFHVFWAKSCSHFWVSGWPTELFVGPGDWCQVPCNDLQYGPRGCPAAGTKVGEIRSGTCTHFSVIASLDLKEKWVAGVPWHRPWSFWIWSVAFQGYTAQVCSRRPRWSFVSRAGDELQGCDRPRRACDTVSGSLRWSIFVSCSCVAMCN